MNSKEIDPGSLACLQALQAKTANSLSSSLRLRRAVGNTLESINKLGEALPNEQPGPQPGPAKREALCIVP